MCPGWDLNRQAPEFKPGRSADWRTWAGRRKRWDSNPQAAWAASCFQDRLLIRPVRFRRSQSSSGGWNGTSSLHRSRSRFTRQGREARSMMKGNIGLSVVTSLVSAVISSQPSRSARAT